MLENDRKENFRDRDEKCSFYYRVGACRHGEACEKKHMPPVRSYSVLIKNLYFFPSHNPECTMTELAIQEHLELFYEDFFTEISITYGYIIDMVIALNISDHLLGNIYIKFSREEEAIKCVEKLNTRFYADRLICVELCHVDNLKKACCKEFENLECLRAGFCNFIHRAKISQELLDELYDAQEIMYEMKNRLS
ncbi:RNA-binding domain-containing protein [Hamiltosporidium tvaerminnensis]|uniref:RNA-binding domain-containing protein n=1 Tax=Hamiltosporidium tvaerminnensis TaxID=1176355 RepID=A0A4Q9L4V2_9MICR|nr:hypothetical protein LUQ84_002977 [Hamiltosporidium tvaerminnensis]TBU02256.1 RNA-binding domain-containing protein [Hamiltosporidium tvaerminnensis]